MSIPGAFIEELLTRVDIVEVIGRYVPLKKSGANFMGLCPFHGERTPSFSVSPSKQFFHCFSCGKGGDAIAFLRAHTGMDFPEAVQELAASVGLNVPQEDLDPQQRQQRQAQRQRHDTLGSLLETAARAYRQQLKAHTHAIEYLKNRGVSGEIARRYGLGYAPAMSRHLSTVFPDYDSALLVENGLVIVDEEDGRRYDRFRDRIMFPILDVRGRCIGFGGRVLGDARPKYLNSPETPLFHKGRELYGLYEARNALRETGYALVVEGYMDVVALAQHGLPNAVATLGTACTGEHVQKLLRFTSHIVFSFDGDAAGQRAAHKAMLAVLPFVTDTRRFQFLFLPPEHDPDTYIRAHDTAAFERLTRAAMPLDAFLLQSAAQDCDLGTAQGRAQLSSQARLLWQQLPESTFKRLLLGELARSIQLEVSQLQEIWQHAQIREQRRGKAGAFPTGQTNGQQAGRGSHAGTPAYAPRASGGRRMTGPDYGGAFSSPPRAAAMAQTFTARPGGGVATGANQAMRLLLWNSAFMQQLDQDDLDTLAQLPAPHGPLFKWLEDQCLEHGPQSWAVLHQRVQGTDHAAFVAQLMQHASMPADEDEAAWRELRRILAPMQVAHINALLTQTASRYASDPQAGATYRALLERRARLEALRTRGD